MDSIWKKLPTILLTTQEFEAQNSHLEWMEKYGLVEGVKGGGGSCGSGRGYSLRGIEK